MTFSHIEESAPVSSSNSPDANGKEGGPEDKGSVDDEQFEESITPFGLKRRKERVKATKESVPKCKRSAERESNWSQVRSQPSLPSLTNSKHIFWPLVASWSTVRTRYANSVNFIAFLSIYFPFFPPLQIHQCHLLLPATRAFCALQSAATGNVTKHSTVQPVPDNLMGFHN